MKQIYLTLFAGKEPFKENNKNQKVIPMFIEDIDKLTAEQREQFGEQMLTKIIKAVYNNE